MFEMVLTRFCLVVDSMTEAFFFAAEKFGVSKFKL